MINVMRQGRGFTLILLLLAVIAVAIVAGGFWYWHVRLQSISTIPAGNSSTASSTTASPQSRIAFVKGGEVWIANEDGSGATQITNTSGTVGYFAFSPDLRYLAYSKLGSGGINKVVDTLDLKSGQIAEVTEPDFGKYIALVPAIIVNNLSLDSAWWTSDYTLEVSAFDMDFNGAGIVGTLEANFQKSSLYQSSRKRFIGPEFGFDNIVYPYEFYVEDHSQSSTYDMYAMDLATLKDQHLGTWHSSSSSRLGGFAVNHAGNNIVLNEEPYFNGALPLTDYSEQVWLYDGGHPILLYTATSSDGLSPTIGHMEWSYNDQFIALDLDQFSLSSNGPASIVIINASNPAEQTQIGINVGPHDNPFHYLQWTKDNQLIFEGHGGVYIFNLHTGNTSLLFASSSEPYVFSSQ